MTTPRHQQIGLELPPAVYSSLPSSPTRAFLSLDTPPLPPPLDLSLADSLLIKGKEKERELSLHDGKEDLKEGSPLKGGEEVRNPSSLWEYLQEEIWANEFDAHQEMKCKLSTPCFLQITSLHEAY
jgi:hypothetical protein